MIMIIYQTKLFIYLKGFAPNELATRIDHAEPKVIIAASCGLEPTRIIKYLIKKKTK